MSILDSSIAPGIFLLAVFGVLAGFFRKTLIRVLITLVVTVIFLAIFPQLLLKFVLLVQKLSDLIR